MQVKTARPLPLGGSEKHTHTSHSRAQAARVLSWTVLFAALLPAVQVIAQSAPPATLVYSNRPIVEFRASFLERTPADRVAAATAQIDGVVASGSPGPVKAELVEGVMIVAAGSQSLFVLGEGDLDDLTGETLERKASLAVSRLQTAINEELELRTPARLAMGAAQVVGVTVLLALLLSLIRRAHRDLIERLPAGVEHKLEQISAVDPQLVAASKAGDILRRLISFTAFVLSLVLGYYWLTFVLRRFPYSRPLGESLRERLFERLAAMGLTIVRSLPDLLMVLVIVLVTRFVARFMTALFEAVEQERVSMPLIYPETAQPTRRIVTVLLWLFALVVSYPYLPGSDSDAFRGVSVFVGLIVSLGSSGIVGQMMSGLTITYSRALRLGDFVTVGDVTGTVTHIGSLSTKVKTYNREDVTIPNSVVVSSPVTNYSRFAYTEAGVSTPTTVTLGYDVPWRQVHAMLLLAAERTSGIRRNPAPVVRQTDLTNLNVEYTLLTCLEQPNTRMATLHALRANIQDVFNEFGVQMMTPNYEGDPDAPKVVPRDKWYAAPASPPKRPEPLERAVP